MDSSGATLNALLVAIPILGATIVLTRIRRLKRGGALATLWQNADDERPVALLPTRFERALILAIYACIMGVLVALLRSFIVIHESLSSPRGWRSYVPIIVVGGMVTAHGAILFRAAKRHLPHILDTGSSSANEHLP